MNDFYTYAFLREDKTPYYVGKGRGRRVFDKKGRKVKPPANKDNIIFLKKNLTEQEAFRHEVYMIFVLGRKHNGSGMLVNFTDGGEGVSGLTHTPESRRKMKQAKQEISLETREKLRSANTGHTVSTETREKISRSRKGHPVSEKTREKIRLSLAGRKKKPFTEEHKNKIRQSVLSTLSKKRKETP